MAWPARRRKPWRPLAIARGSGFDARVTLPEPFVLLDDAGPGGGARLYRAPAEIVRADRPEELTPALARLRASSRHAAGFLSYEAGHALEPALAGVARAPIMPLLWFGLFDRVETVDADAVLPDPAGAWAGAPRPPVDAATYQAMVVAAQAAITAGDIYQANISFDAAVPVLGDPRALYAGLRRRQRAGHGALLFTGTDWLLSLSPELFFTLEDGILTARPMKGTAPRTGDDAAAVARLRADPKQRAENLMIVDLLRNDLARVATPGSVAVPRLFAVESYPTVHQMTSTVIARLAAERDAVDALVALFPCGSITGAPKLRAMELIAAIEGRARGIYTGAIGRLDPDGDAAFNVAIRTLHLRAGAQTASLGLGAGIVADSVPAAEWRECLDKGAFVATPAGFDLIETMAFDPVDGLLRLDLHLARMKASAEAFGFPFDRHQARNELQAATFRLRDSARVRLLLAANGALAVEARAAPAAPDGPVGVALVPLPVAPADIRLRHKTSDRGFLTAARTAAGSFEVAFVDPDGFLTEGSFSTLFVARGDRLLTPPVARGLLPGILRQELLDSGRAEEADLTPADLADGFLIGNALRGLLPARVVAL
ncbi:aminodeoxychorismate synthase component I [Sphingomonas flavalba]|uniref:aminodeoxychorismate synthase component I n=1 Tax=Sphingomonas flavalba TaxID=2559804 RepID=UPI0019D1A924|nr:aminodeoxychorismate synthase component I [Sphingomonas flavalba]